ncbi:hypothetical protein QVD17_02377 [Tagetes erecta]|uniref:Uncharacterized protein n=1 Tax=Tagetes erecta TaxID=13708 RepID=A0AAD8L6H4_TARER|nr:hypothetical protein QVD17_02377 [Tagetes erecta]
MSVFHLLIYYIYIYIYICSLTSFWIYGVGWAALRLHGAVVSHGDDRIKETMNGCGNKLDWTVTFRLRRDGGGSMDVGICMLPKNMAAFERDEEFSKVTDGE